MPQAFAQNQPSALLPTAGTSTAAPLPNVEATEAPVPLGAAASAETPAAADIAPVPAIEPVAVSVLSNVSLESIGGKKQDGLGAEMWKGTSRVVAERLLSSMTPSSSSILNNLAQRLLMTAATPPEGEITSPQLLTSKRVEKLILFGNVEEAWSLAKQADAKLIDAQTFKLIAENALANGDGSACSKAADFVKAYAGVDWQEFQIVCRLRAKDIQAAQVALDVLRSESRHDPVFIGVADRNILSNGKSLPFQLTPLSPMTLALLQQANLPVPGSLFTRAEYANVTALLRLPTQQDVARLAMAERAAERGLIGLPELGAIYRATNFPPDVIASPLASNESGLRFRALLFRALDEPKEPETKIVFTAKFAQSATPAFLNGTGDVIASMLGDIQPSSLLAKDAALLTRLYMLTGKNDLAKAWFALAQKEARTEDMQAFWPQFVLAGYEADSAYVADFGKWFDAALKTADESTVHNVIAPTLLFFEAMGLDVPESAWEKVFTPPFAVKKYSYSPVLFGRLRVAAADRRRAETVLLALSLAGEGEVPLPIALGITSALYRVGFKNEAALFARQSVSLLTKDN
ncbi:MAG: hypothetical protein WC464_07285 [Bdellovibrionales bacterium]